MPGLAPIPARIVLGVTGHRRLRDEPALASAVSSVIDRIERLAPSLRATPLELTVISPLAEGADRLVAREVLKRPGARLEAVLPLEPDAYAADFERPGSRAEFEALLSLARTRRRLPAYPSRAEAYAAAGRFVVDHCDVLIAIWDGDKENGQGGTAEIVQYARDSCRPLFWVRSDLRAEPEFEPGRGINVRALRDLDVFNSERADEAKVFEKAAGRCRELREIARKTGFVLEGFQEVCSAVLSQYYRTDILALRYQHLYLKAGSRVYALATGAVAAAALQALFFPEWRFLALIEAALIGAALALVWFGHKKRWHTKWIDYRFLAERFRSALFLAFARADVAAPRPPRHLSLSYSSQDWMINAFMSFWSRLPRPGPAAGPEFSSLRSFILEAWIDDQVRYHQSTSLRHGRRNTRLARAGGVLLGLTLAAVLGHFIGWGGEFVERVLLGLAIVFPAVAAALAAVRTHREYLRNSLRSREMARHLEELRAGMMNARSMAELLPLVQEAEQVMLYENADWRVVIRFHEIELPA
jgi:hypothetical protein